MDRDQSRECLVEQIVHLGELCAGILAHMTQWQGDPATQDSLAQAFRTLLSEVLRNPLDHQPRDAIDGASRLIAEAVETIESEILLVEPPERRRPFTRSRGPSRRPR
jgi:hypothetical protein